MIKSPSTEAVLARTTSKLDMKVKLFAIYRDKLSTSLQTALKPVVCVCLSSSLKIWCHRGKPEPLLVLCLCSDQNLIDLGQQLEPMETITIRVQDHAEEDTGIEMRNGKAGDNNPRAGGFASSRSASIGSRR